MFHRPISRFAGVLMAVWALAACTTPVPRHDEEPAAAQVDIAVARDSGQWHAEYSLSRDAPVWVFIHSSLEARTRQPWRPKQWVAETAGVILEHRGRWDILRAADGGNVPRHFRLTLKPDPVLLEADYPVLQFSDGATALYSGAFDIFPLPGLADADKLPDDLNEAKLKNTTAQIHWQDKAGPVLLQGERLAQANSRDDSLYVLFGNAETIQHPKLVTVSDPQLPPWIANSLEDFAPRIAAYYTERLGSGQTARPTVMITWRGPTAHIASMGGSVLPGLIAMTLEGEGLLQPSPNILARLQWFIAHESAHFWLGQTVHYATIRDSWMTEGGADVMAVRALKKLTPSYDDKAELQREIDDCAALAVKPVADAGARGAHRAYYACGAAFALVAEASQKRANGGDWFDFVKSLIDQHRQDKVLTRDAWLAQLTKVSGDPALARGIADLLDRGAADPAASLATLFDRAQVKYRREGGKVILQ